MNSRTRNRLVLGAALIAAAAAIVYTMFFSLTPPRHADHDHAIAKLDAGGFLWVEAADGERRNLVGVPGKVLMLHWFDPLKPDLGEQRAAADFAARVADDPDVEVLLIAQAPSWEPVREAARAASLPEGLLYLDKDARTGELCGVRRLPETLVFDPEGLLAFQARGPLSWSGPKIGAEVERAKRGVDEIH